jgi:hypothetical protein
VRGRISGRLAHPQMKVEGFTSKHLESFRVVLQVNLPAAGFKHGRAVYAKLAGRESSRSTQHFQTILDAASKVDGRSVLVIAGRAGQLTDTKPEHHRLRDHLIVENEVIGIFK